MIPKLTRYGARIAALVVLAIGALIAVSAITDDPAEIDAEHPGQAAAEQQAEAEAAYEDAANTTSTTSPRPPGPTSPSRPKRSPNTPRTRRTA